MKVTSHKGAPYDLISVLVRDHAGRFKSPTGKRIKGELPQAEIAHATEEGLRYDTEFQSPLGSESLGRVIVRDNLTGRISTLTLALPTGSAEK